MKSHHAEIMCHLHVRLGEIAATPGNGADTLSDGDIILDGDMAGSAGLLEFAVWYDVILDLDMRPEEMTIDNLDSLGAMADFALAYRAH